jgi:glycogen operon protein
VKDIAWLAPNGHEMTDEAWNAGFVRCLGFRLDGHMTDEVDERGRAIEGTTLLILLNAHHNSLPFKLPETQIEECWQPIIDTARVARSYPRQQPDTVYELQARSMVVMQLKTHWAKAAAKKGRDFWADMNRWRTS